MPLYRHRTQEEKDKISRGNKGKKKSPEHCKHISEGKKGKLPYCQQFCYSPKALAKKSETKRKSYEERKSYLFIIDGQLLSSKEYLNCRNLKGTTIKEALEKHPPATLEEIEKWLSEHLVDSITELECMKEDIN